MSSLKSALNSGHQDKAIQYKRITLYYTKNYEHSSKITQKVDILTVNISESYIWKINIIRFIQQYIEQG